MRDRAQQPRVEVERVVEHAPLRAERDRRARAVARRLVGVAPRDRGRDVVRGRRVVRAERRARARGDVRAVLERRDAGRGREPLERGLDELGAARDGSGVRARDGRAIEHAGLGQEHDARGVQRGRVVDRRAGRRGRRDVRAHGVAQESCVGEVAGVVALARVHGARARVAAQQIGERALEQILLR